MEGRACDYVNSYGGACRNPATWRARCFNHRDRETHAPCHFYAYCGGWASKKSGLCSACAAQGIKKTLRAIAGVPEVAPAASDPLAKIRSWDTKLCRTCPEYAAARARTPTIRNLLGDVPDAAAPSNTALSDAALTLTAPNVLDAAASAAVSGIPRPAPGVALRSLSSSSSSDSP